MQTAKKKLLITTGPVWVPIDSVRVITNIFGGRLGFEIAKEAIKRGFDTTVLVGPTRISFDAISSGCNIVPFHYYNELKGLLFQTLKKNRFQAVIHSAAVSDYEPYPVTLGKIKSGKENLRIKLRPTIKLVDQIKKISPKTFLVKFKLEVNETKGRLLKIARESMVASSADLIVANDFSTISKGHQAYIIRTDGSYVEMKGKSSIAREILKIVEEQTREE